MNLPMTPLRRVAVAVVVAALLAGPAAAQTGAPGKPDGEMRWALYVTLAPAWFDPGEVTAAYHAVLGPLRDARRAREADARQPA